LFGGPARRFGPFRRRAVKNGAEPKLHPPTTVSQPGWISALKNQKRVPRTLRRAATTPSVVAETTGEKHRQRVIATPPLSVAVSLLIFFGGN